jgi:hypothetical protein
VSTFRTRSGSRQEGRLLGPAERARTMIAGATGLRIGVLNLSHEVGRHAVGTDGSLLFLAPADSPGAVFRVAPRLPAQVVTVTTTDVATVPQHDRIRGSLRLTGPVRPAMEPLPAGIREHLAGPDPRDLDVSGPVLRMQPSRVTLTWHCERGADRGSDAQEIPIEAYRAALPDPMIQLEARWLPHLLRDHAELLRTLAAHAYDGLDDSIDVRPLAMDRFGFVIRLYAEGRHLDKRLTFTRPVTCGCDLRDAFNDLLQRVSPGEPGFSC